MCCFCFSKGVVLLFSYFCSWLTCLCLFIEYFTFGTCLLLLLLCIFCRYLFLFSYFCSWFTCQCLFIEYFTFGTGLLLLFSSCIFCRLLVSVSSLNTSPAAHSCVGICSPDGSHVSVSSLNT